MFEYTKNNHIRCSYTSNALDFSHGKISNSHLSWREECKNVAKELYELHSDKLVILLSGGLDSEVVLHSFIANKIFPKVAIFRYEQNLNLHDINYALRLCAARGISPQIIDINVRSFFDNQLLDFAYITKCSSPQLNLLMHYANNVDGIPVIGAGENYLVRKEGKKEVYDLEESRVISLYKFFENTNREAIPAFFQYTPEAMLSFLQKESVYRWVETAKMQGHINSKKIKASIIAEDFDIEPRGKLTGFELMDLLDQKYRKLLLDMNLGDDGEVWTPFVDYIRNFGVEPIREIEYV
jgi:hypothetical protein